MKTVTVILLSVVIIVFSESRLAADVAYSNLGPDDTFNTGVGFLVQGSDIPNNPPQTIADAFISLSTGMVSSIDVAIAWSSGNADINISLQLNDPTTNLPLAGTDIFLGKVTAPSIHFTLVTLASPNPVMLSLGIKYWLVLSAAATTTRCAWADALNRAANPAAYSHDGGHTFTLITPSEASAFRVNTAPVPEPATLGLLSAGMIAFWIRSARKRSVTKTRESL